MLRVLFSKEFCKGLFGAQKKLKKKIRRVIQKSGRNNQGKITVPHRGGGLRRLYRMVDFYRYEAYLQVNSIEYDGFRTTLIANCLTSYILLPLLRNIKRVLISRINLVNPEIGDCTLLRNIAMGSFIHNIEEKCLKGGIFARSAGSRAKLLEKFSKFAKVRLNSGEIRLFDLNCRATVGLLGGERKKKYKAGQSRWLGSRPSVRGVAMNPVDHPHGGGEGKTSGGRFPVNSKGNCVKGLKTRRKKIKTCVLVSVQQLKNKKRHKKKI